MTTIPNGVAPAGSDVGDDGQLGQVAAVDRERADRVRAGVDDHSVVPSGASRASNGPSPVGPLNGGAAEQRQRAVAADRVREMLRTRGVDGEQVPAVVADLDPARRGLAVGERRGADRGQDAVAGDRNADTVPRFAPLWALETNSWDGLVGRNSLPNGPRPCAGNGEPGAASEPAVDADGEAVDQRGVRRACRRGWCRSS